MSSKALYRLSGMSLLIGSLITIIGSLPNMITPESFNTFTVFGSVLNLIGIPLIVLGLPGMYLVQARRAGILGLIGFIFTLCCKCDYLVASFFDNYMTPITESFLNGRVLRPASKALSIAKGRKRPCCYYAR